MRVKIKTDNGYMDVDLDRFLPTSLPRMKKLFRLMRSGMMPDQLQEVRRYLVIREAKIDEIAESGELKYKLRDLDVELAGLKKKVEQIQSRRREVKDQIRKVEQEQKSSESWLREFDYICGEVSK